MNFDCTNCSKCCENIFLPFTANDDEKKWIEFHGIEIVKKDMGDFIKINNKCSKLKNGKCSIYEERPNVCRKYNCEDNKEFL